LENLKDMIMQKKDKNLNAKTAIDLSLREKRKVEILDADGEQTIALNQMCDESCDGDGTTDYWGVHEGGEWHVCIIKDSCSN